MGLHAVLPFVFPDRRHALRVVGMFDVELDLVPNRAGVPTLDPSCRTINVTSQGVDQVARIAGKNARNPLLPTPREVNGKELSAAHFIELIGISDSPYFVWGVALAPKLQFRISGKSSPCASM